MNEFSVFFIHLPIELCKGLKVTEAISNYNSSSKVAKLDVVLIK